MENLNITEMENHPIKWVCNFKGQRAIGICGKTQKIAMFASDERDTAVKKRTDAAISNVSSVKSHQDSTCRLQAKSLQTKI